MKTMLRLTLNNVQHHVACSTDVKTLARLKRVLIDDLNNNTQVLVEDIAQCRGEATIYNDADTQMSQDEYQGLLARIEMQTDSVTFNYAQQASIALASTIDDLRAIHYKIEEIELINYQLRNVTKLDLTIMTIFVIIVIQTTYIMKEYHHG